MDSHVGSKGAKFDRSLGSSWRVVVRFAFGQTQDAVSHFVRSLVLFFSQVGSFEAKTDRYFEIRLERFDLIRISANQGLVSHVGEPRLALRRDRLKRN